MGRPSRLQSGCCDRAEVQSPELGGPVGDPGESHLSAEGKLLTAQSERAKGSPVPAVQLLLNRIPDKPSDAFVMGKHARARQWQARFSGMPLPRERAKAEGRAHPSSWMPQSLFLLPCPLRSGHLSPAHCLAQCHCPLVTLHPRLERDTSI